MRVLMTWRGQQYYRVYFAITEKLSNTNFCATNVKYATVLFFAIQFWARRSCAVFYSRSPL